ncbi:sigma-70 family RNA polymerase sigma factor [Actinocorallia longicatena]|uniref:Sigma-70 family RNA polymerase sigma factor n=1 Tax=Actinocorallia longicatena TaxID=111803 RepID=A0ABP6QDQ5_9ACTN
MVRETRVTAGELVAHACRGDQPAWDALVDRFQPLLWTIARTHGLDRASAEDAVQATWLRLVQKIGTLWDPESVGSWLATVCRNEARALVRVPLPRHPPDAPAAGPTPEEQALARDHLTRTATALSTLSDRCQGLLRLLAAAATYTEVSAALNVPMGSIGPTRSRCLHHLQEALGE